jgi:hypothetical protein
MKEKLFICFLTVLTNNIHSQEQVQVVRGHITSIVTGKPINNATIAFSNSQNFSVQTDSSGYYEKWIVPGNYSLTVIAAGFRVEKRTNIVVHSGKQQVLDVALQEYKVELDSVTVSGNTEKNVPIELWNVQRYAAAFYDPGRVVTSHAAIINTDDQANNLSIHGTSPNYIQWKVEGVEVVNPNHLENAGTLNDRPSLNGGGVSLFSAQLLQNSGFQLAPFESQNGNALTGIFDMRLRNGNNKKYEHVVQASLLGLDYSIEGPFSKKQKASFLCNYRYSTVGVLSKLGVDFNGEKINFQDLSFIFTIPNKNGQLKIFSINGTSETIFKGPNDTGRIEGQKDLKNINYDSKTTINGVSYLHSLNNTMYVRGIVSYSKKLISRNETSSGVIYDALPETQDIQSQEKISNLVYLSKRIDNRLRMKIGSYYNYFTTALKSTLNNSIVSSGKVVDPLLQPFVSMEGDVLSKLEIKIGLHSLYHIRVNDLVLQPRINIQYSFTDRQDLSVAYGRSAQLQPFYLYTGNAANNNLKPAISNSFSFIHHLRVFTLDIKNELFLQYFKRLPVNVENHFSAFNYFNEQILFPLEQKGTAQVYGYDLTIEKKISSYYIILSSSIFNSTYKLNGENYNGRFNTNYNTSLTAGKEFIINTKKTIEADVRFFMRDGFRENTTADDFYYSSRLSYYNRVDLRICYRKEKERSSVIWALDIQNVTNRKNMAYHYYDSFTKQIESKYQLGIIPVLSYKVFF